MEVYSISNSNLNHCGDKGISIGEMSSFVGIINVENSNIGISKRSIFYQSV